MNTTLAWMIGKGLEGRLAGISANSSLEYDMMWNEVYWSLYEPLHDVYTSPGLKSGIKAGIEEVLH